ncbi:hypothetical protein ACVRWQ_00045 [Streptococcus phocae subsp. salmonis]|uniref:hypothetical protein n=1 Tax=Streptococcus phocae TaxID=119224 RepID=UPI0005318D1A|nr:hypothetical protein [Streptococcus phocae]KGR72925.1 hypothetical protein NX86_02985 [Streptococcus phocae subsp. salmonis]
MKKKLLTFSLLSLLAIGLSTTTASADEQLRDLVNKINNHQYTVEQLEKEHPEYRNQISRLAIGDIYGRGGRTNITVQPVIKKSSNLNLVAEKIISSPLGSLWFKNIFR